MKRKAGQEFPPASSNEPVLMGRRALLAALPALGATGCIGSFALTNKLLDWNRGLGNKWVSWLVMAVLFIIPVYPILFGIVDLFVINSIEFWSGDVPFAKKDLPDGGQVVAERTEDPKLARLSHTNAQGQLVSEFYIRRDAEDDFTMLDRDGRAMARFKDGHAVEMSSPEGERMTRLDARQVARIRRAVERGASPAETTWQILEEQGDDLPMLAFSETCQRRVVI